MAEVANDITKSKFWTWWAKKAKPILTWWPVASLIAVGLTNGGQLYVQGLIRDVSVLGAETSAAIKMAGAIDKKGQASIELVALSAADKTSTRCTEAIETLAPKKPAPAQRRPVAKPKETGSLW